LSFILSSCFISQATWQVSISILWYTRFKSFTLMIPTWYFPHTHLFHKPKSCKVW
jgi:hypothetical protein